MKVGIDAIYYDLPKLYLSIRSLAQQRNIEYEKLNLGLGLERMSIPDVHQDVVTFATNATYSLLNKFKISASDIGRIFVGTESAIDSSKPIASYIAQLLEQKMGIDTFKNCDLVDMTFACIGAVDAFQSCLDYVRLNPDKKAIVVATDIAKYDLNSSGEYTQGAGAIALLISSNPRLLSFSKETGVSSKGVFDFFKPRRVISKTAITGENQNTTWMGVEENQVSIYKEQPIFDGQYSNECYINRISDAYLHYKQISKITDILFLKWENIIMHLPYCFQARRTFLTIYAQETKSPLKSQDKEFMKSLSKSDEYLNFVNKTMAPAEIASSKVGNMYTGSIFLALLSTLSYHYSKQSNITGKTFGFIAYGSGSKSKVFEAIVEPSWEVVMNEIGLFETLENCKEISFETYLGLHKKELQKSILEPKNEFFLNEIEENNPNLIGARYYGYAN